MSRWWPKRYGKRDDRPSWDEYFLQLAQVAARRSTCRRRQVGAVLVRDKRILATGYNGAPMGLPHCLEIGCLRDELGIPSGERHEVCRGNHAEANAIASCALHGIGCRGATLYCSHQPCILCTKLLINAGVVRVVYQHGYPDEFSRETLAAANIEVVKFPGGEQAADEDDRPAEAGPADSLPRVHGPQIDGGGR